MTGKYLICEGVENTTLFESEEVEKAWAILFADKERTFSVVQISPAVRVSLGEKFGMHSGEDCMGKIATALFAMGADAVVDAAMGADVVALLETQELRARKEKGESKPLFSAKCTAVADYIRAKYPDIDVSSVASENAVSGALLKEYYKKQTGKTVRIISVEPCKAKKFLANVDTVITADELELMLGEVEEVGVSVRTLKKRALDIPFGVASGAAYISEVSGGMSESIVRCLLEDKSAEAVRKLSYAGFYGLKERREVKFESDGKVWNIAIVCGMEAAESLIKDVRDGKVFYDYVEISACEGGCVCGTDLPESENGQARLRVKGLQAMDAKRTARAADVNAAALDAKKRYEAWLRKKEAGLLEAETDVEPVELKDELLPDEEPSVEALIDPAELESAVMETTESMEEIAVAEVVEETIESVTEEVDEDELEELTEEQKRDPYYRRMSKKDRRKKKRANKKNNKQ